jgi:hypothetical protein
MLTGSQFRGISEASTGSSALTSPTDYPLVQLRSVEGALTSVPLVTNWTSNACTSAAVSGLPSGYALATVFVNGIPGASSVLRVDIPSLQLVQPMTLPGATFEFEFFYTAGSPSTVLASSNLTQPLSNWAALGSATEISPGQFQFTDPQAMNYAHRFYQVRSP